jgi:hypothetical protein
LIFKKINYLIGAKMNPLKITESDKLSTEDEIKDRKVYRAKRLVPLGGRGM